VVKADAGGPGWSTFASMLQYKAALYGRDFRRIGRWEPT
jgi:putative transposase